MRFRNIIEKKRLILTEWDNSAESKKNFKKAIKRLKNDNIEFIVVERRLITEFAKRGYFIYSVILDSLSHTLVKLELMLMLKSFKP